MRGQATVWPVLLATALSGVGALRAQEAPAAKAVLGTAGVAAANPDSTRAALLTTPGGVRYWVRETGTGARPQAGSRVAVRYAGFLPNGRSFDATAASGGPLRFRVGRGEVIPGWDELLPLLPAGTRVRTWIPAALAYGAKGVTDPEDDRRFVIPPNTDLIFELQLVSVR